MQFENRRLYRYCVAIANEGGGYLVLGVTDKSPRSVVGTAAFNNPIEMAAKLFQVVGFRVDIEEVLHPDGRVLVFHIPSRPHGTAYHHEGAYLMRSGEELVPMSEDQLRRIFAEGGPDWLEEFAVTGITEQDVAELLDTQGYFELLNLPYPSSRAGVIDRLLSEQLVSKHGDGLAVSRLGALLLARRLGDIPSVSRKSPRIVVYQGLSKLETRVDRTSTKGYAVGFQDLVTSIMDLLPQNEVIEDAVRKEVKLVPEIVIRELVANALIHQDFSESGTSVMIELYENRVEISNPGEPVVPVERFIDGYQSRNERLADLMRRFGICEEKSSGIDRVIEAAEIFQLPAPDFQVGFKRTSAIIAGPRAFRDMDRRDRIRASYQHCVLQWVMRKQMTNQTLRKRFGLSERSAGSVSQIISATVEEGLIKPDPSSTKSRRYVRYIPHWA